MDRGIGSLMTTGGDAEMVIKRIDYHKQIYKVQENRCIKSMYSCRAV